MPMTKRDIADIVLVGIVFWLLFQFLMGIVSLVAFLGRFAGSMEPRNTGVVITFQVVYVLVLLGLGCLVLFKRSAILSFLFPDGQEKEFLVPSGMESLASYGFWIRLFGILLFLSSGIHFFSQLIAAAVADWQFSAGERFWVMTSRPPLISAILAGVVVWKADWIAEKLQKMGAAGGHPSDAAAKNQ